ncbi:hypothetical protein F7R91_03965 [Streptomyces luteolifulvus]|uniref:Uncharacterized protein n=1 Tax=Streptomyces luteolifulvus TaxID=2615112 RepID=A0A6H9V907_9ACTN|nr:hypothetical protein [Streptomyces luteolifulvus]KAB1149988.1 hypothetical protein F7R91_03965 [Streptomyces luteolifulvus]
MHGNPLYHWIALAVASALMLPLAIALLRGWVPPWTRGRTGGLRLRAYGILCLYGGTLANGVPRLAKASFDVVMAAMLFGIGFYGLAAVLFLLSAVKDNRARAETPDP